jgi:cell wall-associated NlpC family hydrolase
MFRPGTLRHPGHCLAAVFGLALALASVGCASSGAVPQPFPRPGGPGPGRPAATSPIPSTAPAGVATNASPAAGYAIAGTALGLRGTPYRNGGSDPSGFDCSGFIWYVFGQYGIRVPRTVGEQSREGTEVDPDALEPGDLLFFKTRGPSASHVGMAIGGDEFVHAPSSRGEVRVERLSAPYWASRYIGARRVR